MTYSLSRLPAVSSAHLLPASRRLKTEKEAIENEIKSIKENYENKINSIQRDIFDKNQKITEQAQCLGHMSELCKSFDVQKFDFQKEISEIKKIHAQTQEIGIYGPLRHHDDGFGRCESLQPRRYDA